MLGGESPVFLQSGFRPSHNHAVASRCCRRLVACRGESVTTVATPKGKSKFTHGGGYQPFGPIFSTNPILTISLRQATRMVDVACGNMPLINITDHIEISQGDLTEMDVDAIVNAANNDLQLGGGVAGAIRRKGGPQIQAECDEIGTIPVGGAAITSGGKLKARYVIHAASMQLGGRTSSQALRSSIAHSLRIAAQKGLRTIAFPAVGTGIAECPVRKCAEVMLREAAKHFDSPTSLEKIYFVLFDKETLKVFQDVLGKLNGKDGL